MPKVGERVLVEAAFNPNMPFKWNATRVQVLPNQVSQGWKKNSKFPGKPVIIATSTANRDIIAGKIQNE